MRHLRNPTWTAIADDAETARRQEALLPRVLTVDRDIESRIERLAEAFRVFSGTSASPPYAPGLIVTPDIHRDVEIYLPMEDIRRTLGRLARSAIRSPAPLSGTIAASAASWYAVLEHLHQAGLACPADPSALLRRAITDSSFRTAFLFALFLPEHYGGRFNRYPRQMDFLRSLLDWRRVSTGLACLDAACGTGEQAWDVAEELAVRHEEFVVEGLSLNPLEVFAAAHGYFPADAAREREYRQKMARVLGSGIGKVTFCAGDLRDGIGKYSYDLILCNGLLGGPFIHEHADVLEVMAKLAEGLMPGGVLLAADRFHQGWKKRMSQEKIADMCAAVGLEIIWKEEGIAARRA